MPNYFYTAKSFEGNTETGMLNAKDQYELAQSIRDKGLILVKALPEEENRKFSLKLLFQSFRVSLPEKIIMVRNLGVMSSTGLSFVKIFEVLSRQTKNKKLSSALIDIKNKINKGENLSSSLARYPNIFSELFVNMVKVGEESGTLDDIFQILSLQLQKEHELKSKIKNAMIYPVIILVVMLVVGIIIITVVLPNLKLFFNSLNAGIPIYTKILLWTGDFLSQKWYLVLGAFILVILSLYLASRTKIGKKIIDAFLMKLPLISKIVKKNNAAFLIRSLSSLITAGVPLTNSLEIASKTVSNHYFKDAALDAEEKIKKGWKLSDAFKIHQDIFPFGVTEMVEIGEETGKSSTILKRLADFYEQEAISAVEQLSVLVEPLLIVVLGLGVAFFAFSIIVPMYSSLKAIG